jgi:hypothetical protein
MIKFGMTVADMIAQLTRGFTKQTGRLPSGLEKIKIQQEAIQRFKDMNKVVDMKGNPINPAEGILGGEQAQNFSKKLDPALYEDRGRNIIPAQFDESPAFPSYTAKETEEQIRQRLLKNNKDGIASMKSKLDDPEKKADGGRAGFVGGGMGRRGFLKLLGGVGAGIGALKSGILGFGGKKAGTQVAKEVAKEVATSGNYPPPYFFKLVEKIKFMGDDITEKAATQNREIVKRYKDYEMTEDIGTGNIVIKKRNEGSFYDQDGIISDEYIVYKPGQADELTKGKKPPPEYDEYTVRPDSDGKLRDSEDGLDSIDEILEEVGDPDSMTLKKADGGRIGYKIGSSKKGVQSLLDLIRNKFGKESITTADKIPVPNDTLKRNMFDAANKRFNKSTTPESEKIVGNILEDTDINDLFDADGKLNKDAVLKAATSKDVDKEILRQYSPENAVDDIFPSGDYKYDADMAAEAYVENNPEMFKNMLYEDLDDRTRSEVYSKVLAVINQRNAKMLQTKRNAKSIDISNDSVAEDFTNFIKKTDPDGFKKLEQRLLLENAKKPKNRKLNASGGLAAMLGE